jgi:hypothetical protein
MHNKYQYSRISVLAAALFLATNVQAQSSFQFSTGLNYSSGDYGETTSSEVLVVPFSFRFKTANWAFRASIPYVTLNGPADSIVIDDGDNSGPGSSHSEDDGSGSTLGDRSVSGLGDVSLSVTRTINDLGASNKNYLDITGRVRLPTGDANKGFGVDATDYGLSGEFGHEGDGGGAYVQLGRRFLGAVAGSNREDGWQAGFGAWRDIGEKTAVGFGYDWREASTSGNNDPQEVFAYLNLKTSKTFRIGFEGSVGLNDASADYGVKLTFTWRSNTRR